MTRCLVTGGAGFIGSTLTDRLLAEGHEVDVVDDLSTGSLANLAEARSSGGRFRFHHLDIGAPDFHELVARRRPEVVFHLAAQASVPVSVARPLFDAEVNVLGTLRVLEAARSAKVQKVVYAASGGTLYGEPDAEDLPIAEHQPHGPLSPYGVSKMAPIDYMVTYRRLHGLEFTALALANVYGPRQDPHGESGVVAIFAERLVRNEPCVIFGDGEDTRDYVYVDDVVDAFARAARRGGGLVLNIGTGLQTSTNRLYGVLAAAAGSRLAPQRGPARPGDVRCNALDPDRASIHLGWKPWTPLEDGVAAVIASVRGRVGASR
ncbi:MAG TPA: NAD-dependent epimerase/dehydratase family protein [Acidimicrobiales bacterium]|nr:NAD-dependent epimerase/dehydratase family protein [Acidimicrobiales bacterium]